jgi:CHAT domain-containing protein/tetratricopeptide (TPR) repeat protein
MITRIIRFFVLLFALGIFLFPSSASGQSQPASATVEPSVPEPSAAVARILDNARRLAEAKQPGDSLKAADQAIEAARQANDTTGGALAQQARAKALKDLQRTDEALAAWQEAARIWQGLGDTPEEIRSLVQAGLLCVPNKKSEAEKLFAQGLAVSKIESNRPLAVAQALYDSGNTLSERHFVGSYAKLVHNPQKQSALDYLNAALAIREKRAPGSLALAETLSALAAVADELAFALDDEKYFSPERDDSARAVEILQRLAPDSALLAESLHSLGNAESNLSNEGVKAPDAREHFLAALRIQEKLVPAGSMEEASILHDLGSLESKESSSALAHEHLVQAVALGERLDPESPQFAYSLEFLGIVELELGELRSARDKLERALAIEEKSHAFLAPIYVNLGGTAYYESDYAAARDYFEKALELFQKVPGGGTGAAFALGNLGDVYSQLGDLTSALEYRKLALDMLQSNSPSTLYVANAMHDMGDILKEQGNFSSAADFYQRALALQEKLLPDSPNVAETLGSLAGLARAQKNTNLAMEYDRRALATGQRSCPDSWCVVGELNDTGELAYELGDLLLSEKYLRQAVNLRETKLGPASPDLADSLNNLARTLAAQGKTDEALVDALRAERIGAEHLRISVRTLTERQALAYEAIRASGLDLALTLAGERAGTASARSQVFDAVIHSRAVVFDELAARRRSAYGSADAQTKQLADQLFSARARLATLVFRGVGDSTPATYRNLLDDARKQKENAERGLAEKSAAFRKDQVSVHLGLNDISASLPPGGALVAYVHYAQHDLRRPVPGKTVRKPLPSYAAFVLQAGKHEPDFVRLGSAHEIARLLQAWRRTIAQQAEVSDESGNSTGDVYLRAGTALRRKIWDPIAPLVGNTREVFVVPDAGLHLVNLASLPAGNAQYLIDTGPLIHYLSTERDLVPVQSRRGEGILVVGNPAFDQAGNITLASDRKSTSTGSAAATTPLLRGTRSACGTFKTLHFPPLPASQQEADNIAALWKKSTTRDGTAPPSAELLRVTGSDASLEAFEQYAPGKRVLHVATHGFFLEGSCDSATQRRLDTNKADESFLPATAENPLLLSGLAFAGANRRGSAKPDETDGILTAEEIAGINLEGVDWAVLSACDTGVGEIKVGEGVFGLRRAFQVAGAKTVIMSLWPVEDETTRQWMGTLYREHFLNGKDTGESVRAASLQILKQRRARHQSTHPFYWGAFIAAGDWH